MPRPNFELRPKFLRDPFRGRARVLALIPAIVALLAYGFCVRLRFQIDDYGILPASGAALRATLRLVLDPGLLFSSAPVPRPNPESPLFQPVCWALHAAEIRVFGTPLDPARFHLVSAFFHALTTFVLTRLAARLATPKAALVAGVLFAVSPASAQAVTWVAARGLVLVTLFGLLAFSAALRSARTGSLAAALLSGLAAAAALGCHVAAASVAVIALGTVVGAAGRPTRRHFLLAAVALVPIAAMAFVRARYLGGSGRYVGGVEAGAAAIPAVLRGLPSYFAHFLAPSSAEPTATPLLGIAAGLGVGVALSAAATLSFGVLAGAAPWTRGRRPAVVGILALGVLAVPGAFLWALYGAMADHRVGRVFYAPAAAAALLVAALFEAAAQRGRVRLVALPLGLLLLLSVDGLVSVARLELAAAERIGDRARAFEELSRELPDGGTIVAVDKAVVHAGVPLVTTVHLRDLANPPFSARPQRVQALDDITGLATPLGLLGRSEAAVVVLFHDRGADRVHDLLPPAAPLPFPGLAKAAPAFPDFPEATTWAPARPVAPRLVAAVRVRLRPGSGAAGVDAVLRATHTQLLVRATARPSEDAVVFGTSATRIQDGRLDRQAQFDWLLSAELRDVTVRGPLVENEPIELLDALPPLAAAALVHDRSDVRFAVREAAAGMTVLLALEAEVGAARYRTIYRGPLGEEGGTIVYRPAATDIVETDHESLRFDRLAAHQDEVLARFGVRTLTLHWTLDLLNDDGASPRARSARSPLALEAGR